MIRLLAVAALVVSTVAACGTAPEDRAAAGGGFGAATGAVIGAASGVSVLNGALIGGTAGALAGALTTSEQIDLGEPVWRRGTGDAAEARARPTPALLGDTDAAVRPLVREIQNGLRRLGYDPGIADGRIGPRTRLAIGRYQRDNGLRVDRRVSPELLRHIEARTADG